MDTEEDLESQCNNFRKEIGIIGKSVKALMEHSDFKEQARRSEVYPEKFSEMKANIMLCYRHLEDARMRIGKILQAAENQDNHPGAK